MSMLLEIIVDKMKKIENSSNLSKEELVEVKMLFNAWLEMIAREGKSIEEILQEIK